MNCVLASGGPLTTSLPTESFQSRDSPIDGRAPGVTLSKLAAAGDR